jgi:hypothetical protein
MADDRGIKKHIQAGVTRDFLSILILLVTCFPFLITFDTLRQAKCARATLARKLPLRVWVVLVFTTLVVRVQCSSRISNKLSTQSSLLTSAKKGLSTCLCPFACFHRLEPGFSHVIGENSEVPFLRSFGLLLSF